MAPSTDAHFHSCGPTWFSESSFCNENKTHMLSIEKIAPGISMTGIEPAVIVTVVAVVPIAEGTVQLVYKTPDGTLKDRLLNRSDESNIDLATVERPWSFEGDGEAFKLTVEAKRIDLAFLFDPMMAVHTSNVE